MKTKVVTD